MVGVDCNRWTIAVVYPDDRQYPPVDMPVGRWRQLHHCSCCYRGEAGGDGWNEKYAV